MFREPPDPHPTLHTPSERALYWGTLTLELHQTAQEPPNSAALRAGLDVLIACISDETSPERAHELATHATRVANDIKRNNRR